MPVIIKQPNYKSTRNKKSIVPQPVYVRDSAYESEFIWDYSSEWSTRFCDYKCGSLDCCYAFWCFYCYASMFSF